MTIAAAAKTRPPPNILFILTDDQGYGDSSAHGNPIASAPGAGPPARTPRSNQRGASATSTHTTEAYSPGAFAGSLIARVEPVCETASGWRLASASR